MWVELVFAALLAVMAGMLGGDATRLFKGSRRRHRITTDLAILKDLPEGDEQEWLVRSVCRQVVRLIRDEDPNLAVMMDLREISVIASAQADMQQANRERKEVKRRQRRRYFGFFVLGVTFAFFILLV